MTELMDWPGFYWVGVVMVGVGVITVTVILAVLIVVLIASIRLKLHCRKPETDMILTSYRTDVRSGEGEPIKAAGDLHLIRIIGCSWKLKWIFGLLIFGDRRDLVGALPREKTDGSI